MTENAKYWQSDPKNMAKYFFVACLYGVFFSNLNQFDMVANLNVLHGQIWLISVPQQTIKMNTLTIRKIRVLFNE